MSILGDFVVVSLFDKIEFVIDVFVKLGYVVIKFRL